MTTMTSKPVSNRDKARGNIAHSSLEQDHSLAHIALMNSAYILKILDKIFEKAVFHISL